MVKFPHMVVLCIALIARIASAQTMNIEDRKAVLDAKIDILRKEADLEKALAERSGADSGLPTVVAVNIIGGQRSVLLQMANGTEEDFHEGEEAQRDVRISSIALKKVVVSISRGKKTVLVPLALTAPITNANQNDPNRNRQAVPRELLPEAPVVTVPDLKSILPLPSQVNAAPAASGAKPVK